MAKFRSLATVDRELASVNERLRDIKDELTSLPRVRRGGRRWHDCVTERARLLDKKARLHAELKDKMAME